MLSHDNLSRSGVIGGLRQWMRAIWGDAEPRFASRPSAPPASASGASSSTDAQAENSPPSLWLYAAGLVVMWCGLFAVTYNIEDRSFTLLTYLLTLTGTVLSYTLRARGITSRNIPLPALAGAALVFVALAISERGVGILLPADIATDRAKGLQLVFVWLSILHSFLMTSDSSVLFACVPCLTMISLVSTGNQEVEVRNAFLLFVASATFLMVHENFLRTKVAMPRPLPPAARNRLFAGQLVLAGACVVLAFFFAGFVASPLQSFGQSIFLPGAFGNPGGLIPSNRQVNTPNVEVTETEKVELARGPQTESNQPLLHIECDRGLYWRGATFEHYTGHAFESRNKAKITLNPAIGQNSALQRERHGLDFNSPFVNSDQTPHFIIPLEETPEERNLTPSDQNGELVTQNVRIAGGLTRQIYGATAPHDIIIAQPALTASGGGFQSPTTLPISTTYKVRSWVPTTDPDRLRKASSKRVSYSNAFQDRYLDTGDNIGSDDAEQVADAVRRITTGLTNNYDKTVAIQQWIAQNCKYNLQSPKAPSDRDVVAYFLFDAKQGYCDSFGAAMTMMCRYAGIPARLCSGFLTGDLTTDGEYVVREKHKHIWTEVWFPGTGWVKFDATENSDDISDHSSVTPKKDRGFLAWLADKGPTVPILGVVVIGALCYVLKTEVWDRLRGRKRARKQRNSGAEARIEILRIYRQASGLLARRGLTRAASETLDEFAVRVRSATVLELPDVLAGWEILTDLSRRFAYGATSATEVETQEARLAYGAIDTALRNARNWRWREPPITASLAAAKPNSLVIAREVVGGGGR